MLSGLDHLVVTVTDMGRAVDFYSRVLGLDVRYRDAQRVDLMLGVRRFAYIKPTPILPPFQPHPPLAAWTYACAASCRWMSSSSI